MPEELIELIHSLDGVDTYDKENVLIDIFIFYLEHKQILKKSELLDMFAEVTRWRDISLVDGSEEYYERIEYEQNKEVMLALKKYAEDALFQLYQKGFSGEEAVFERIDSWIFENKWKINDWLSDIICKYMECCKAQLGNCEVEKQALFEEISAIYGIKDLQDIYRITYCNEDLGVGNIRFQHIDIETCYGEFVELQEKHYIKKYMSTTI